jgi:hypothetical protein
MLLYSQVVTTIKSVFDKQCRKQSVINVKMSSIFVFFYENWFLSWRTSIETNGKVVFGKYSLATQIHLLELLQTSECSSVCLPNGELDKNFVEYISARSPHDINTWIFALKDLEFQDASECSIALARLMEMAMREAELIEIYTQPRQPSDEDWYSESEIRTRNEKMRNQDPITFE